MTDPNLSAIVDRFIDSNERAADVRDFPAHGLALLRFVRDHVHPGEVFGDRVAFVPGVAEAACDWREEFAKAHGIELPGDDPEEADPCTVEATDGRGLVAELCDALSGRERVALVVNGEQLAVLIEALQVVPRCNRALRESVADLLPGLRQLFGEAFGRG